MANKDAAFGLSPISTLSGADYRNLITQVYLPASYATAAFKGQAVRLNGDSNAAAVTGFGTQEFKAGQLPEVVISAATENIDYVIVGFEPDMANEDFSTHQGLASTERVALAVPVSNVIFEIQCSGTLAVTDVGGAADIVGTAGNTTSGISTTEMNTTVGATGQLQIMGVSFDPNNSDISSANCNFKVRVRESNLYAAVNAL